MCEVEGSKFRGNGVTEMVRRLISHLGVGDLVGREVCVNVSGLFVEIGSPGLDEIRRVPVLRNPSAV
jgi:hypothetical protein